MKLSAVILPVLIALSSVTIYRHFTSVSVSRADLKTHLKNKVVLVCDAGTGLGEQLAYELAEQGARLMLVARTGRSESRLYSLKDGKLASPQAKMQISANTLPQLNRVKNKALKLGSPHVETMSYDFGNVADAHTLVDTTVQLLGTIDYLVLNQVEIPRGAFLKLQHLQTPEYINQSFSVNVFSFIEIALKAMPHLEKSKGHIFVTSSTVGEIPNPGLPIYSATKHALNGFFYSLQQELIVKKSPVTLSIGALGEIGTGDKMPVFKLPEWMVGDMKECALGMMKSLISRPTTFTYPTLHPSLARLSWYFLSN